MLFQTMPACLHPSHGCVGRATLLLAILAVECTPASAHAGQAMLTAEAARLAIAQVVATPAGPDAWLLGAEALAITALVAAAWAMAAQLARRRRHKQPPVIYTALPRDSAKHLALEEAQALWPHAPVAALGRLYQGLLERLASDYSVVVPPSDTEPDVLQRVAALRLGGLEQVARSLLGHWQQARYAAAIPGEEEWAELCRGWQRVFPNDVAP